MNERPYYWVFDPSVLKHVRFDEFSWLEIWLILLGLSALAGYFVLVVALDRYARYRMRLRAEELRLNTWLKELALDPDAETALRALAGSTHWRPLYRLLSDPRLLEVRLHQALTGQSHSKSLSGVSASVLAEAVARVRHVLRYYSSNARYPVVSTRQLRPGDTLHLHLGLAPVKAVKSATLQGYSCYAWVTEQAHGGLVLQLAENDFQTLRHHAGTVSLTFLRDLELEYAFPWRPLGADQAQHRYLISHGLTVGPRKPRQARLPFLHPIPFHVQAPSSSAGGSAEPLPAPFKTPACTSFDSAKTLEGLLLDVSEGGFALVYAHPVTPGSLIRFVLALGKKVSLPISGRVLACLPFQGNQWQMRCEIKGFSTAQENQLRSLLRQELNRRLTERKRTLTRVNTPEPAPGPSTGHTTRR